MGWNTGASSPPKTCAGRLPIRRSRLRALGLAALVAGGLAGAGETARAEHPNALWYVVHDLCVPDMRLLGHAAPCTIVNLAQRYVVLKDPRRATQLLLVPTQRISGIESPDLLTPKATNYWALAWDILALFAKRTGGPVRREDFGLAVNSQFGRTQNQLHIHIDCVQADVQAALAANLADIGPTWTDLAFNLRGHRYRAMALKGAELGERNPFKLLAQGDPEAAADMNSETLAVIGVTFADGAPGFVLVSGRADMARGDKGAIERLLDHRCAVLEAADPPKPSG